MCWWEGVVASAFVRPKATCSNMLEQVFHKPWVRLKNMMEQWRIGATGDIHCIVPQCKRGVIREEERCIPHVYRGKNKWSLIAPDKPSNKPYTCT